MKMGEVRAGVGAYYCIYGVTEEIPEQVVRDYPCNQSPYSKADSVSSVSVEYSRVLYIYKRHGAFLLF